MEEMFRSSIPLGRLMGVEVRLHFAFPLLLLVAGIYGQMFHHSALRGIGVWAALLFAVLVRETARALAAAYLGLRLRAVFLLPMGGVMAFAPTPGDVEADDASLRPLVFAAPAANLCVGLLLLGMAYACAPGVSLLVQPWISAGHVLRSFVWMQFVVCALNLLPVAALPTRQLLRGEPGAAPKAAGALSPAFSLLAGLAMAMMLAGMVTVNLWLIGMGAFTLLYSQLQRQTASQPGAKDGLRVQEAMLTHYAALSTSDTVRHSLAQAAHSLQDVFPVLRGDRLVGAVSRQTLIAHLKSEGDGYVQGVMTRQMQPAAPDEPLLEALRRASANGASEFIPVAQAGRLVGILTPQGLGRVAEEAGLTRSTEDAGGRQS